MTDIKHRWTAEILLSVDGPLRDVDFMGRDLSFADLAQGGLAEANLTGINLHGADLTGAYLIEASLTWANLERADLTSAHVISADLFGTSLRQAKLSGAQLCDTNMDNTDLAGADLANANLYLARLTGAILTGTDFANANLDGTVFVGCETLSEAKNLDKVFHLGPSTLDHRTLRACIDGLPDVFLEGCGYTRLEIETMRALYCKSPIRFYSCFISHGESDLPFCERLLADLRHNNVTCWHYKENLRAGESWSGQINQAIKHHDKLVLVCSRSAVYRPNVVKEILRAIEEERLTGKRKLFPIRLDDHILGQEILDDEIRQVRAGIWPGVWVEDIRRLHIPDFSVWDVNNSKYRQELNKLLEALRKAM